MTGPKWSGYGPLISGSVYTGCGCQLPRFEAKNQTGLDFKTLSGCVSVASGVLLLLLYKYDQHFTSHITRALEGREVWVMSYITSIFEAIFSYSKTAVFSSACSTPSVVSYTRYLLMRVIPPLKISCNHN
jgi:hypothetical protein